MTMTPDQARTRLTYARQQMRLATMMDSGRENLDPRAGLTAAVLEVITLLEDALA